jgi:dUTP pyrophosphatase
MRKKINIKIKKLTKNETVAPTYATEGSVGADLCADTDFTLVPGHPVMVGTGYAIELPEAYEGQIRPRSGMASKHGITVLNAPGTIDPDYRGEIKVVLVNHSRNVYRGKAGTRIAQLVINPVTIGQFVPSEELGETNRGEGGFGSTGE